MDLLFLQTKKVQSMSHIKSLNQVGSRVNQSSDSSRNDSKIRDCKRAAITVVLISGLKPQQFFEA